MPDLGALLQSIFGNINFAKPDTSGESVRYTTASPLVNITDQDINRGVDIAKSLGPLSTVRPYANVPDALMGFRKSGQNKAFEESAYPHEQAVAVTMPGMNGGRAETFLDSIKGMNADHAIERAYRNWPDAIHIMPIFP